MPAQSETNDLRAKTESGFNYLNDIKSALNSLLLNFFKFLNPYPQTQSFTVSFKNRKKNL